MAAHPPTKIMKLIALKPSKTDTKSTVQSRQWKPPYFLNLMTHHETNSQVSLVLQVLPSHFSHGPCSCQTHGTHFSASWKCLVTQNVDWKEDLPPPPRCFTFLMLLCRALHNWDTAGPDMKPAPEITLKNPFCWFTPIFHGYNRNLVPWIWH